MAAALQHFVVVVKVLLLLHLLVMHHQIRWLMHSDALLQYSILGQLVRMVHLLRDHCILGNASERSRVTLVHDH